jgi:hypothetical protein
MNAEKPNYRPIKFLDRMEGNNHIVLLYDSQKYCLFDNSPVSFERTEKRRVLHFLYFRRA